MEKEENTSTIWLEVTNVRSSKIKVQKEPEDEMQDKVEVQVKGDRAEREPVWWTVNKKAYIDDDASKTYRTLSENLDKKRIVLAGLGPENGVEGYTIQCRFIRIQYAESAGR